LPREEKSDGLSMSFRAGKIYTLVHDPAICQDDRINYPHLKIVIIRKV